MNSGKNIAVLGAGIMGLCTATILRARGHTVTLYDPAGFPAKNASAMAGGMLAPYSEIEHMPLSYIEAAQDSISFWREHGADFKANGSLFIAHDEDRYILERFKAHVPVGAGKNVDLEKTESQLVKFRTGFLIPDEAHLDPQKTIASLIAKLDATKIANTCDEEGQYDFIIDCTGLAANDKDLRGVKGETVIVQNKEFSLSRPVRLMHPRYPLYIVPRADNIFMIGATVIEGAGEHVSVRSALELLSAAYSLHPSFGEAQIFNIRAGVRPAYADNLPRIKIDGNRVSCNGLFRHGFLLAPAMAACVADAIENSTNKYMSLFNGGNDERHNQRRAQKLSSAA